MLKTLEYKIFIDENLNDFNAENIFNALKKIHDKYNNLIEFEKLDNQSIEKLCSKKISKNYVLFTKDEDILRKWQIHGGKAFYINNKEHTCYPDADKLIITNFPKKRLKEVECDKDIEVEEIYEFLLKCLHIYN